MSNSKIDKIMDRGVKNLLKERKKEKHNSVLKSPLASSLIIDVILFILAISFKSNTLFLIWVGFSFLIIITIIAYLRLKFVKTFFESLFGK